MSTRKPNLYYVLNNCEDCVSIDMETSREGKVTKEKEEVYMQGRIV